MLCYECYETDGAIGDHYPEPDRMLRCAERVVHTYLVKEVCAGKPPRVDVEPDEAGAPGCRGSSRQRR